MKKTFGRSLVLFAGLNLLLAFPLTSSRAEPESVAPEPVVIKLQHVRPEMMAYWIYPKNRLATNNLQDDQTKVDSQSISSTLFTSNALNIPGLEDVVANLGTDELLVKGTPESIRSLREIISFLDWPSKRLGIKIQFVEMDQAEIPKLGIQWNDGNRANTLGTPILPKEKSSETAVTNSTTLEANLKASIASRKAKSLLFSQTTVVQNSMARISQEPNSLSPGLEFHLTPTIQNDNTVILFLTVHSGVINQSQISQYIPEHKDSIYQLTTVANLKEGDSMVLRLPLSNDQQRAHLAIASVQILEDE